MDGRSVSRVEVESLPRPTGAWQRLTLGRHDRRIKKRSRLLKEVGAPENRIKCPSRGKALTPRGYDLIPVFGPELTCFDTQHTARCLRPQAFFLENRDSARHSSGARKNHREDDPRAAKTNRVKAMASAKSAP